jgi:FkbM family methyltransferase
VVYDIGANVGYFSLMAAMLAGDSGKVYAFEPLPRNIDFLCRHIQLNHINSIEVMEAAVSDHSGMASFDLGASTAMGHIAEGGELEVKMVSLDDLLSEGKIEPPDYMKVDVEGAEFLALSGAKALLNEHHPLLFLDTHNRKAHQATISLLMNVGYRLEVLDGKPLAESKELIARFV